jgi:ribosomal protein S18 acetylase RimI-like enzyme
MTPEAVRPLDLEAVSARAWRAACEDRLGGWRLNASAGFSRRINACWPLEDPGMSPDAAIAVTEAWCAARGLPAIFKLTSGATWPADLAERLEARGYHPEAETLVMVGKTEEQDGTGVDLWADPDPRFAEVFAGAADDPGDARERLEALARTPRPRAFGLIGNDDTPAAIGACAVEAPWVGIFAMRTLQAHRRLGLARRVLGALLGRAGRLGATRAWLQVEASNASAIALYESADFAEAYRYVYWRAPG